MDTEERNTVIITGFGPFGAHHVNASWEAVQEFVKLSKDLETDYNVNIVSLEVPVCYEYVANHIPKLWEKYKPMFVIHVGVSGKADCLVIECKAHDAGYIRDVNDKCPRGNEKPQNVFQPTIDVKNLCDIVNNNCMESGCKAVISNNAGHYLCEYIFYQSLNIDPSRALFIHVPDLHVYSADQTAKGIYDIVKYLIKHYKRVYD